jgi:hypothetical protein
VKKYNLKSCGAEEGQQITTRMHQGWPRRILECQYRVVEHAVIHLEKFKCLCALSEFVMGWI